MGSAIHTRLCQRPSIDRSSGALFDYCAPAGRAREGYCVCADFCSFYAELNNVVLYFERLCEAHFERYGRFYHATLVKCDDDGEKIEAMVPL